MSLRAVPESKLNATYIVGKSGRVRVLRGGASDLAQAIKVEDFVAETLMREGRVVVRCEGPPFGALFGALMYPWLHDHWNAAQRMTEPPPQGDPLRQYLAGLPKDSAGLTRYFRSQLGASEQTRLHLTGGSACVIETADLLVRALEPGQIRGCLEYLAGDYWGRRSGWPDLFTFRMGRDSRPVEPELVEVKSRNDKLSKSQRSWIAANEAEMDIPFRLVRVLSSADLPKPPELSWPWKLDENVWSPPNLADHPVVRRLIAVDLQERRSVMARIQGYASRTPAETPDPTRSDHA